MWLPGTVERVREQVESVETPRVTRRTVLLGGVGAAVTAHPGLRRGPMGSRISSQG